MTICVQKKRPQIRQIVQGGAYADAMPDNTLRQTLLFSATFPREVQRLAEVPRVGVRRVYSLSPYLSLSRARTHTLAFSVCPLSMFFLVWDPICMY